MNYINDIINNGIYLYKRYKMRDETMKNKKLYKVARNIIAVFVGIITYFIVDTAVGLIAGVLLNNLTQLKDNTIYFQIVLKYIVVASNIRLITLLTNYIAPRTNSEHNISEYIIGTLIIVLGGVLTTINWSNNNISVSDIIFCLSNLILGVILFLDAKQEFI